jgi:hypothetical protein
LNGCSTKEVEPLLIIPPSQEGGKMALEFSKSERVAVGRAAQLTSGALPDPFGSDLSGTICAHGRLLGIPVWAMEDSGFDFFHKIIPSPIRQVARRGDNNSGWRLLLERDVEFYLREEDKKPVLTVTLHGMKGEKWDGDLDEGSLWAVHQMTYACSYSANPGPEDFYSIRFHCYGIGSDWPEAKPLANPSTE